MLLRCACLGWLVVALAGQDKSDPLLDQLRADLAAGRYSLVISKGSAAASTFQVKGDQKNEGRALTFSGLAQLYSGAYEPALDSFTKGLAISRSLNDTDSEITRLNNIGTVFYFQGHYSQAMDRYQEALRRVQAFPAAGWTASRRQLTLANIAILYQTVGQFERALDLYTGLLNARSSLPADEQAQVLANVGVLRRRLGDSAKALETYRTAQDLYKKIAHRDGQIAVLNNIGLVQAMDFKDYPAAVTTFTAALRLAEESGDRPLAVHAHLFRGETSFRAGQAEESYSDFKAATDQANALGELEEEWKALYGMARVELLRGDRAAAGLLLKRAIKNVESLRAGLSGKPLASEFLADKRDVYDLLIENTNRIEDVFRLMEQSRARMLSDQIRGPVRVDLDTVRRMLPKQCAILEYWMSADAMAVLWATGADSGLVRRRLSAADREAIEALPAILANPQNGGWRPPAQSVVKLLLDGLPPIDDSKIRSLLVIPDGSLARIPFEALPLGPARLLIERFSVSYAPSSALIARSPPVNRRLWPWQMAFEGFADPAPGTSGQNTELGRPHAWARLPAAASEVREAAHELGGGSALHIGAAAQRRFLKPSSQAPVLHFATHAFADTQDSDRSYILLAPASPSERFDYLFLREVYALPLAGVDLATASACQTSAGKLVRGEGVESFGRAFLAAGARTVVTSLWSVGDRSTAAFMQQFYARLARGQGKADALRGAKLEFIRNPRAAHPAYWAAFVMNGDGASPIPRAISWAWLLAPVAGAGAITVLLKMRARRA